MSSTVPPLPTGTSDLGATPTHTELARGLGVSLSDNITLSFHTIQTGNINSAMFGGLVIWGLWSTVEAARIWNSKRAKPIYILNVLQTVLNLFKITTATTYAVVLNLYCEARAPLINVAQTVCWDLIYMIMLLKLLLFTPYKRAAQVVYGCVVLAHFVVVMVGVGLSQTNLTVVGTCRDRYPLIYKQQYLIELALEIFTFLMLLHGMTHRSQNLFEGTKEIFKQLKENENLRVFMVTVSFILRLFSPSLHFFFGCRFILTINTQLMFPLLPFPQPPLPK
ncbi:hypothetical protein HK102_007889 [Quaeritorhiza haematococci]|nr:hypothetical protein HK102_007889 [Quaeritorhiza haematococci]